MKTNETLGLYADTTTPNLPLAAQSQNSNQQTLKLNSWHLNV